METRMTEAEAFITTLTTDTVALHTQVKELRATTKLMAERLDDFEGCSRCNHVCIIGTQEHKRPVVDLFVEDLIAKLLQSRYLSKYFYVKCAHCIPGAPPKPGAPLVQ
ncbi:hypothetical protein NDU88_010285 [Pleurodeles waltl]|uniref:Uncharacterized protein n=1 Tax=Pleurodeles waltl TaxID=8319 RepID=A0AAV7S270_PLEWA|nr:hypothetical protein NDU88_010285 [Pleurodeles waltl]